MAHTVIVKSIKEVDLSVLQFPQVAAFAGLKDYAGKAVGKIMDGGKDTNIVIVSDEFTWLHIDICANTNLRFAPRGKEDVPKLVGVFL